MFCVAPLVLHPWCQDLHDDVEEGQSECGQARAEVVSSAVRDEGFEEEVVLDVCVEVLSLANQKEEKRKKSEKRAKVRANLEIFLTDAPCSIGVKKKRKLLTIDTTRGTPASSVWSSCWATAAVAK